MHKRINAFSDLVHIQILCILKTVVNFHKQFRINTQITDISFHTAGINSMQSGIQCREQRSVFPAHLTDGICRVCITVRIIFLHIQIQTAIDLFPSSVEISASFPLRDASANLYKTRNSSDISKKYPRYSSSTLEASSSLTASMRSITSSSRSQYSSLFL